MSIRLPSYSKIDFLIDRKFPTYQESLRFQESLRYPDSNNRTREPEVKEMHKKIIRKAEQFRKKLQSMPSAEVSKRYALEMEKFNYEQELEEREQFYNQTAATDDLVYWSKKPTWSLDEAVALSFDRDPREVCWDDIEEYWFKSPFVKHYEHRRKIVLWAEKNNQLTDPIDPNHFIRWCFSERIEMPPNLVNLIEEKYSRFAGHIEEGLNYAGSIEKGHEVKPEIQSRDIQNSFRFEVASWFISYHGQSTILADALGIRYIVWLIQNQGKEISAFELYNAVNAPEVGFTDHSQSIVEEGFSKVDTLGDAGATMDEQTKREISNRLNELDDEIEIANDTGNTEIKAQLEEARNGLNSYLSSGLDLHGKPRRVSSDIKKRADSVKASIKRSVEKIDNLLPLLGKHLKGLHLGSSLSYTPDHPVEWVVDHTNLHSTT